MINRLKEFQNVGLTSSIPQGILDPDEMGALAFSPAYEASLDERLKNLSSLAEDLDAKILICPQSSHGSAMYKKYVARAAGTRIVIDDLFELKCSIKAQRSAR
jgi:hypothetical protein